MQQHTIIFLGAFQISLTGRFQACVAVLAEFLFPFLEKRLGYILDGFDPVPHLASAVFAGFELTVQRLVALFKLTAFNLNHTAITLQGILELFLGLLL